MQPGRRINLLRGHLCATFEFSGRDEALAAYKARGVEIDSSEIRQLFFSPRHELLEELFTFVSKLPSFNHLEEVEASHAT